MEPSGFNPENLWLAEAKIIRSEQGDDGSRVIDGIASTGITDRMGTQIDQKTLGQAARKYAARNGKIFYNHNWTTPIGKAREVHVRDDGLHLRAEIGTGFPVPVQAMGGGMFGSSTITMQVDDIWNMIRQGMLSSYSIGFDGEPDPDNRQLIKVRDLFEVSVVSLPANPDAEFAVARALDSCWAYRFGRGAEIRDNVITGANSGITIGSSNSTFFLVEDTEQSEADGQSSRSFDYAAVMEELRKCRSL